MVNRRDNRGRAGLADQLGPDAVPVVGPAMPAADLAGGVDFDQNRRGRRQVFALVDAVPNVPNAGFAGHSEGPARFFIWK